MGNLINAGKKTETAAIKNAESSSTIGRGRLVCLKHGTATNPGLDVVLPANAGTGVFGNLFGVAINDVPAGKFGETQLFGSCEYAILRRATRGASTDSWASGASLAEGHILAVDTVNNCFSTSAASQAASLFLPIAVMNSSLASYASSASATSDTRTALTNAARVLLRML